MPRIAITILLVAGLAIAGWFAATRMSDDNSDRRTPVRKKKTAASSDGFLGTDACLECHPEKKQPYLASAHARTFWDATDVPIIDQMVREGFRDDVRGDTFQYDLTNSRLSALLPKKFGREKFPLQFVLGSGEHAYTFLSLVNDPTNNKRAVEHRVSWYHHNQSLGLTPGHEGYGEPSEHDEHFGKVEVGEDLEKCIGCHTTTARVDGIRLRNLRPNVGCESCHGAGQAHADAVYAELDDPAIRFSSGTWTAKKEMEVCAECHRAAEQVPAEQLTMESTTLPRFQPVGLAQSACFKGSAELSCSTCHNPHEHASATSRAEYVQSCVECHDQKSDETLCPISPEPNLTPGQKDCIHCHMPAIEVQKGIFFHDHWIRVRQAATTGHTSDTKADQ